ncbi:Exocyst complex component 1 [Lucilia cuprina]|nr:Exocyst complex component 1 [Lucilia cuprina]
MNVTMLSKELHDLDGGHHIAISIAWKTTIVKADKFERTFDLAMRKFWVTFKGDHGKDVEELSQIILDFPVAYHKYSRQPDLNTPEGLRRLNSDLDPFASAIGRILAESSSASSLTPTTEIECIWIKAMDRTIYDGLTHHGLNTNSLNLDLSTSSTSKNAAVSSVPHGTRVLAELEPLLLCKNKNSCINFFQMDVLKSLNSKSANFDVLENKVLICQVYVTIPLRLVVWRMVATISHKRKLIVQINEEVRKLSGTLYWLYTFLFKHDTFASVLYMLNATINTILLYVMQIAKRCEMRHLSRMWKISKYFSQTTEDFFGINTSHRMEKVYTIALNAILRGINTHAKIILKPTTSGAHGNLSSYVFTLARLKVPVWMTKERGQSRYTKALTELCLYSILADHWKNIKSSSLKVSQQKLPQGVKGKQNKLSNGFFQARVGAKQLSYNIRHVSGRTLCAKRRTSFASSMACYAGRIHCTNINFLAERIQKCYAGSHD